MKTQIDILLTNAVLLTMDEEHKKYDRGAVAIQGERIFAVGPSDTLEEEFQAQEEINCGGKVVMPGLINAHTHVPMNLLRGLADDLRLDVWLLGYIMPVERKFVTPEFVRLGTSLACAELIRSGVTCFADMYYFEDMVAQATAEAGLRAVCAQTILKFEAPDALTYEEALASSEAMIKKWKGHPLITPAVAPHAAYTATDDILSSAISLALDHDIPLHTHIAETQGEVEESIEDHEMRIVPYLDEYGLFKAKTIAAHCVHIQEGEMHTLKLHNAGVAHNPTSNLKLASGIAPVPAMLDCGLNVGIGTDGASSNNDLDMFEEMRLAALLAKGSTGDPTVTPAKTALTMATRMGAEALHLGQQTGSLSPGKRADLITVDISALHNSPRFQNDPDGIYAQLVYAAKSTDVQDMMVNGAWVMRGRKLLTIKVNELLSQAQELARDIDRFITKREQSMYSKLISVGGAVEQESYEVQAKVKVDDPQSVIDKLMASDLEIIYDRHYHEYDTYFEFEDSDEGWLRYREDEFINEEGDVYDIRYRLTLIGPTRKRTFPQEVLLSRSRFIAPATHSLRFYREYFQPSGETFIEKDRLRWKVSYQGIEFYINLDRLEDPDLGTFLEVKSRTWSLEDAEKKAELADGLLSVLGVSAENRKTEDYVQIVESESA